MANFPPTGGGNGSNGGGPPSPNYDPYNQSIPLEDLGRRMRERAGDTGLNRQNDVGFQPPFDPLQIGDAQGRTRLIYRDIPLVQVAHGWKPEAIRNTLAQHMMGLFDASGQLVDQLIANPRITATLNSRLSGLFGREVKFRAADDSSAAKECLDAWIKCWPKFCAGGALQQISAYQILFGWWPSQICWDPTTPLLEPVLRPWHARFTYYHWDLRQYIALAQDGQKIILAGDGKWLLHAPRGEYRAWVWGALRAVSWPWLLRTYSERDMSRFSEVYGQPTRVGITPAAANAQERDQFAAQLANLGAETTLLLSTGVDGAGQNYDYKLVESTQTAWQVFSGIKSDCDLDIILAIMMQNLTTEVTSGSFAATTAHMDIRQAGIESDNESWRATIHDQVARAFAFLNFGDANLAPWTDWDCRDRARYDQNSKNFLAFGQGLQIARQGGIKFTKPEQVRQFARTQFDVDLPADLEITEPDSGSAKKPDGGSPSTPPKGGKP